MAVKPELLPKLRPEGYPLVYVPIEPLEERYTASWYRNFPPFFESEGFSVTIIDGEPLVDNDIKVGTFLDINSTTYYKSVQLQKISQMFYEGEIQNGTIFFFGDLEFWGIEQVRLLADMNNIKVYLTAFLHAGSYTKEDAFAIASPYQQYTEVGWVAAMDKVFVGSAYHRRAFIERRLEPLGAQHLAKKIVVTKNPLFPSDYPGFNSFKEKKVLLTNRFDYEKRPNETLQLFMRLKDKFPNWKFVVTTSRKTLRPSQRWLGTFADALVKAGVIEVKVGLTKEQYHKELDSAQVMVTHSIEENYGLCIAEALIYNVWPVMRAGLSHDEFPGLHFNQAEGTTDFDVASKLLEDIEKARVARPPSFDLKEGVANILAELIAVSTSPR